jgi:hypothetical protein
VLSRQLFLGETLDTDQIEAHYDAGVLTLRIPVAEQANTAAAECDRARRVVITNAVTAWSTSRCVRS